MEKKMKTRLTFEFDDNYKRSEQKIKMQIIADAENFYYEVMTFRDWLRTQIKHNDELTIEQISDRFHSLLFEFKE